MIGLRKLENVSNITKIEAAHHHLVFLYLIHFMSKPIPSRILTCQLKKHKPDLVFQEYVRKYWKRNGMKAGVGYEFMTTLV